MTDDDDRVHITELTGMLARWRGTSVLVIELQHDGKIIRSDQHASLRPTHPRVAVLQALVLSLRSTLDYYLAELEKEQSS
jgi:hypothetical protein